ncbi:MAG TPA: hypothetical protein VGM88_35460 [Kofleriaceae bacterium]
MKLNALWLSCALGMGSVCALGNLALAQPAPQPAAPADPNAPPPKPNNKTDEKADTSETLQKGGDTRPWAAGVSPSEQQTALALFREGNEMLNNGLFPKAVEKYHLALKHWDHPAINYNLALALLNLDQPIEVDAALEKATSYGEGPLEHDKFEHAKEYKLLVEKQIAWIEVSCDKQGAKVSVDGKEVFTAPGKFTQKVRVGKHTFYADKQGYNARITAPYVGPGEHFRIELKLYTAEELTRYKRKWDRVWAPYTVIGAGVVVGLGAVGAELLARHDYREFDKEVAACNTSAMGCSNMTAGIYDKRNSGNTWRDVGYVGFGVAGAAVATGIALAIVNRREGYQITAEQLGAEHGGTEPLTVVPMVSPDTAGAMVQGHF